MRGLIGALGLVTLFCLILFAALVAAEIDWVQIQAEVFNASIDAWGKAQKEGISLVPLLPALGWVLGIIVAIIAINGLLSVLGGMVFKRRKAPQPIITQQQTPAPAAPAAVATPKKRRWFTRAPQLHASEKEIFPILAEITGYTVRNWDNALEACRRHIAEGKGAVGVLHALNGPKFAPLAGLTFGNPIAMRTIMAFIREGHTPKPRAPRAPKAEGITKPKAEAASATPVAAPVVAAEPAPPAAGPVPATGPEPTLAAAAAKVEVHFHGTGTKAPADEVVEDAVVVEPTPATKTEPPIPSVDRSDKGSGGKRDGKRRMPFNPDEPDNGRRGRFSR